MPEAIVTLVPNAPTAGFRVRQDDRVPPVGDAAVMVHGTAALPEVQLQEGDVLCVATQPDATGLCLLLPRTLGHPMVGRSVRQRLLALPSGVPCDSTRWRAAGQIVAVWRRGLRNATLALRPETVEAAPGSAPRRAVCVRVPHAGVALLRFASPHLLARPIALLGADNLVASVSAEAVSRGVVCGHTAAQALSACPELGLHRIEASEILRLAARLQSMLAPESVLLQADLQEIRIVGALALASNQVGAFVRGLSGSARVPLAVVVGDAVNHVERAALAVVADEMLVLLPTQQPVVVTPRVAALARTNLRLVSTRAPDAQMSFASFSDFSAFPVARRPAAPSGRPGVRGAQLLLFGDNKAA